MDRTESRDVPVPRGSLYPRTVHTFGQDRFAISVTAKDAENPRFKARFAEINIEYLGDGDASQRAMTFVRQLPADRPITAKVTQSSTRFGAPNPGGAKGTDRLTIDVFGDGKNTLELGNYVLPNAAWTPEGRGHQFSLSVKNAHDRRPVEEYRELSVKSKDAVPVDRSRPADAPADIAAPEPALPTRTTLALARDRLSAALDVPGTRRGAGVPWPSLERQLESDERRLREGKVPPKEEEELRRRAANLSEAAFGGERALRALSMLDRKENYLPDLAFEAQRMVRDARDRQELALFTAYGGDARTREAQQAEADKAMAALPHRLSGLYLTRNAGIEKLTQQVDTLREDVRTLRGQNGRGLLQDRPVDRMLRLGESGERGLGTELRRDLDQLRRAREEGKPVAGRVHALAEESQRIIGTTSLLAMHEQFRLFSTKLDHLADKVPGMGSQREVATRWAENFDTKLKRVEGAYGALERAHGDYRKELAAAKTPEERRAAEERLSRAARAYDETSRATLLDFQRQITGEPFKRDVQNIEQRLATIHTVNTVAKVSAIMVGAAFVGGAAGAAVGGALEGLGASAAVAGTAAFATDVAAFTLASRAGTEAFIGPTKTSFGEEYVTNLALFGMLKGIGAGYGKVFEGAAKTNRVAYHSGQAATMMLSMQGFSELHHLAKQGRMMSGEERYRSAIDNVAMYARMEVGGFLIRPMAQRIERAAGKLTSPLMKKQLETLDAHLAGERAALQRDLEALRKAPNDPKSQAELPKLYERMEALWKKEVDGLRAAADKKAITPEELSAGLLTYQRQLSELQLQLSHSGVDIPIGAGGAAFRPVKPGVTSFADGMLAYLKAHYEAKKGTFAESGEGLWVGELGGARHYYVPAGVVAPPR